MEFLIFISGFLIGAFSIGSLTYMYMSNENEIKIEEIQKEKITSSAAYAEGMRDQAKYSQEVLNKLLQENIQLKKLYEEDYHKIKPIDLI